MRIVDFADGAQSETTPVIGNIKASGLIEYPDDATYEATEQGAPAEGNIYFNTTIKQIRYYNGTDWITLIDQDTAQDVNNKTILSSDIDADANLITNIDNDEIKANAGIDVTKLHDGSVDNTEFGHLDGVTAPIQTQLDAKQELSEKGQPNGYAGLDANGLVPISQLPIDDIDNVDEFPDLASFPATGITDRIYIAADTNLPYRWTGTQYIQVASSVNSINDLTDVNLTGIQDGQVPVWNNATMQLEPGTVQNVIQENIALVGKGTATWTAGSSGTEVNTIDFTSSNNSDFAMTANLEAGYTFTATQSGDLQNVRYIIVDRGLANGDGDVTALIYATSGGVPTGSALAVTAPDASTDTGTLTLNSEREIVAPFTTNPTLTAGTEYFIAFTSSDTGSIVMRLTATDEATSTNYTENSTPPPDWNLSAQQETFYSRVRVNTTVPGSLVLSDPSFVSVPPLANDRHEIAAQTILMNDGQCAYVVLDRSAASAQVLPVVVDDITNVTPDNNILIIARNSGDECYFGLHDPRRIEDGETVDIQKGGSAPITEFVETVVALDKSVSAANTYEDVPGSTLVLTEGTWDIGYEVDARVHNTSGSTLSVLVATVLITDSANVTVSGTETQFGGAAIPVNNQIYENMSKTQRITIGSTTTYKLRVGATSASPTASTLVYGSRSTAGSLPGNQTTTKIFARRVS